MRGDVRTNQTAHEPGSFLEDRMRDLLWLGGARRTRFAPPVPPGPSLDASKKLPDSLGGLVRQHVPPSSAFGTFSPQKSGGRRGSMDRALVTQPRSFSPPQRGEGAEGG